MSPPQEQRRDVRILEITEKGRVAFDAPKLKALLLGLAIGAGPVAGWWAHAQVKGESTVSLMGVSQEQYKDGQIQQNKEVAEIGRHIVALEQQVSALRVETSQMRVSMDALLVRMARDAKYSPLFDEPPYVGSFRSVVILAAAAQK